MLEAVGFPVAVNPESRLAAIARRRGWHVEHWAKASGGSHRPLPLGPLDVVRPGGRPAGHSATGGFATAWAAVSRSAARAPPIAGSPDEGARLRTQPAPLRRLTGGVAASARAAASASGRCACSTSTRRRCPVRTGAGSRRACRGSAARTSPPSTGAARGTSRTRQLPVRPRPRGGRHGRRRRRRRPTGARWPPARGSSSSRSSAAWPGRSTRRARPARPAAPATASASPSATCGRGCRPASAPTPAAAGRPPAWSPTRASSTPCPTS